jgi:hypothetical protein
MNPEADVLTAKVRRLESRVAQLEDCIDVYGPPPKARMLPVPSLSDAQRKTIGIVLLLAIFVYFTSRKDAS